MMALFQCWSVKNILDLYLDGRLTEGAAAKVKKHLDACPDCSEEAESQGGVARFLKDAGEVPVPAGLEAAILKGLEQSLPHEAPAERILPRWTAAKAFAALYLIVVAGSHALPGEPSRGTGPQAEAERRALL